MVGGVAFKVGMVAFMVGLGYLYGWHGYIYGRAKLPLWWDVVTFMVGVVAFNYMHASCCTTSMLYQSFCV